ncbi:MAG: hypothetical protein C4297_06070 [Gemmataceae bacterium]
MRIQFVCTGCPRTLAVAARKAGTVVTCPRCSAQVRVPAVEAGRDRHRTAVRAATLGAASEQGRDQGVYFAEVLQVTNDWAAEKRVTGRLGDDWISGMPMAEKAEDRSAVALRAGVQGMDRASASVSLVPGGASRRDDLFAPAVIEADGAERPRRVEQGGADEGDRSVSLVGATIVGICIVIGLACFVVLAFCASGRVDSDHAGAADGGARAMPPLWQPPAFVPPADQASAPSASLGAAQGENRARPTAPGEQAAGASRPRAEPAQEDRSGSGSGQPAQGNVASSGSAGAEAASRSANDDVGKNAQDSPAAQGQESAGEQSSAQKIPPLRVQRPWANRTDAVLRRELSEVREVRVSNETFRRIVLAHLNKMLERNAAGSRVDRKRINPRFLLRLGPGLEAMLEFDDKPIGLLDNVETADELKPIAASQPNLQQLPWRMGHECHLSREEAENLRTYSRALRVLLAAATPHNDVRINGERLRHMLLTDQVGEDIQRFNVGRVIMVSAEKWRTSGSVPTLVQMLQAENESVRKTLVTVLERNDCVQASQALAQRAVFDTASDVRALATEALKKRNPADYREVLLKALEHPWPSAAENAADVLVAVNDGDAAPALLRRLAQLSEPMHQHTGAHYEMVRINHLSNCVMCHAISMSTTDLVRGRVPDPSQPLPPPSSQAYYEDTSGLFVAADVTYLKQDFSMTQSVQNSPVWPRYQRFDYVTRRRQTPDTSAEAHKALDRRRRAVAYALAMLRPDLTQEEPVRQMILAALGRQDNLLP